VNESKHPPSIYRLDSRIFIKIVFYFLFFCALTGYNDVGLLEHDTWQQTVGTEWFCSVLTKPSNVAIGTY
jgi:hypothetical protein